MSTTGTDSPTPATRAKKRLNYITAVVSILIGAVAVWAVWVQGIDSAGAAAGALDKLKTHPTTIPANRGSITDRNGVMLAQTLPYVTIAADPYLIATDGVVVSKDRQLTDDEITHAAATPEALAEILMNNLGGSVDDYLGHLTATRNADGSPNQYELIATNVPAYTWANIDAEKAAGNWFGLDAWQTPRRVYPDGTLASNVLGFIGADGNALEGFEFARDKGLSGTDGTSSSEKNRFGVVIPMGDNTLVPPVDGNNYQLTLDAVIQAAAQQEIERAIQASHSDFGMVIVMDVKTGEVLAMANAPTFDGNNFGDAKAADRGNRAIRYRYEPGSVQKILTLAALIDQGLITPDTRVQVPSKIKSGDNWVSDAEKHGTLHLTVRGVFVESSNIGTVLLARQSSKSKLVQYLQSFGLGQLTGIQLPGEDPGDLPTNPPDYMRDRMAFGQSLSVTALQEAAAVAGIVNGGIYHQPTIIKSATDASGHNVPQPRLATRRVVSPETSAAIMDLMTAGTGSSTFGKSRIIPGYSWGGKTGTAQRYDETVNGYNGVTSSFMSVGPGDDPQFLVYVVEDNPVNDSSGSMIAMPVAKDLMSVVLSRYGVTPKSQKTDNEPLTYKP